jgi:hypothetical protein
MMKLAGEQSGGACLEHETDKRGEWRRTRISNIKLNKRKQRTLSFLGIRNSFLENLLHVLSVLPPR